MAFMLSVRQVDSPQSVSAVQELLGEYLAWTQTLEVDSLTAPTFRGIHEELAGLPGVYSPPAGRLLLATHDGAAVGCVALKPHHDEHTCELKRLYVRPGYRGLRVGWQLVSTVVEEARRAGYRRIVLDSHISMTKAHDLYRAVGFETIPTPADFPERLKAVVVFMECRLG